MQEYEPYSVSATHDRWEEFSLRHSEYWKARLDKDEEELRARQVPAPFWLYVALNFPPSNIADENMSGGRWCGSRIEAEAMFIDDAFLSGYDFFSDPSVGPGWFSVIDGRDVNRLKALMRREWYAATTARYEEWREQAFFTHGRVKARERPTRGRQTDIRSFFRQ